jgi:F-type H+-transporting ATPase subunit delta
MARALYDVLIGTAHEQLRAAADSLSDVDENDPTVVQERINKALASGQALPQVQNFLLSLAKEKQLGNIQAIVEAFERYTRVSDQATRVEVVSAVELDTEQRNRITNELQDKYQEQLDMHFRVDESLMGGLIIRVGDQVFDNSLRARLGLIQRSMLTS